MDSVLLIGTVYFLSMFEEAGRGLPPSAPPVLGMCFEGLSHRAARLRGRLVLGRVGGGVRLDPLLVVNVVLGLRLGARQVVALGVAAEDRIPNLVSAVTDLASTAVG